METTLLSNWKNLIIDKYNSTIDSDKHLDMYISQVSLFTIDNVILCRVFSMSLKGKALYWFTMLPPNFVDSFDTLVGRFGTQFATSRTHHLTSVALVNIRQEKKKPLRIFMEHFGKSQHPTEGRLLKMLSVPCNRGHSIEECSALKDKIKELIKLDHLKEFVHKKQSYRPEGRNKPESN
ncbi:hypothetical protein JHK82_034209 [Glycine max]|nr:hypothetical protein JHK86_034279 [Glycine max]KAG5119789.1 hypothetical protein JHK82_034209 [Glycine max]